MSALSKTSTLAKHFVFMLAFAVAVHFGFHDSAQAQLASQTPGVDVLIISGPGGHDLAANNIQERLAAEGISFARFDFSSLSNWTFEMTLEMLEKTPEQANEFYVNYYAQAAKAKSAGDLPQGEWHSNEQFLSVLNLVRPRMIITTYSLAMETLVRMKNQGRIKGAPRIVVPTDQHRERYWTYLLVKDADAIAAPGSDWADVARGYGVAKPKLMVTGIPGNPKAEIQLNKAQVDDLWKSVNLDPSITTVVVSGGSGGVGTFDEMIDSIRKTFAERPDRQVQFLFATGSSKKNFEIVQAAKAHMPPNVHIEALGFTPFLPQYLNHVADIVVSKAGGLTTSEVARTRGEKNGVLREGRPLLLTMPAYGIEPGNAEYFFEKGMARPTQIVQLGSTILDLMDHPEEQVKMMTAQKVLRDDYHPERIIEATEKFLAKKPEPYYEKESVAWISDKLNEAKETGKKPILTVSGMSQDQLRIMASRLTKSDTRLLSRQAKAAEKARERELRRLYPIRKVDAGKAPYEVAITIDDLPGGTGGYEPGQRLKVIKRMIDIFKAHNIRPFGFINSLNVAGWTEAEAVLKAWQDAGFEIGNHTHSHTGATQMTTAEFIKDLETTDHFLEANGVELNERRMLRFPMLEEGDTIAKRKGLQAYFDKHGYRTAPITMNSLDFWNQRYYNKAGNRKALKAAAVQKGIRSAMKDIKEAHELSHEIFDREIKHVMLFHLAEINLDMLDGLLGEMEKEGAQFVSLDHALSDPVYKIDHGQASKRMGSYLVEMAYATGQWEIESDEANDRVGRYKPATIQRQVRDANRAHAAALQCRDLFLKAM